MSRKLLSILTVTMLVISIFTVSFVTASAQDDKTNNVNAEQNNATVKFFDKYSSEEVSVQVGSTLTYSVRLHTEKDISAARSFVHYNRLVSDKEKNGDVVLKVKSVKYDSMYSNQNSMTLINKDYKADYSIVASFNNMYNLGSDLLENGLIDDISEFDYTSVNGAPLLTVEFEVVKAGEVGVYTEVDEATHNNGNYDDPLHLYEDIYNTCYIISEAEYQNPFLRGDVNDDGEVDLRDILMIQKHMAELTDFTDAQKKAADVNEDGEIDLRDIIAIQKHMAELPVPGIDEW